MGQKRIKYTKPFNHNLLVTLSRKEVFSWGGCPFRHGFAPPCGRNARLWEGVVVNGLCHPAKVRRGRRSHGRERMGGTQVDGRFGGGGCVGQRTLSRNHGRKRMNGARVEVRFGVGEGVRFDRASSLPGGNLTLIGVSNRRVRLALSHGERVWCGFLFLGEDRFGVREGVRFDGASSLHGGWKSRPRMKNHE